MIKIIAAIGKNNELGKDGKLLFPAKQDLAFFKEETLGHKILMGSNTWNSLPGKLPEREHFVATRSPERLPSDVTAVTDLGEFIDEYSKSNETLYVIGGGQIYEATLPYADELILTEIDATTDADTFFPDFDRKKYQLCPVKEFIENNIKYNIVRYRKEPK